MPSSKLVVSSAAAVVTASSALAGLALASAAGTRAGKKIVDRLPVTVFITLVEAGLVVSGLLLLVTGG